tara:strand:+ start:13883 stop:14212 length:330 start_codon:yes stop_codon:yes gene_type:complete
MIHSGELDQRVTIVAATITENLLNEGVADWVDIRTTWAKAVEGLGREFLQGGQVTSQKKAVFKIRYEGDITTAHRVRWLGTNYEIVDVTGTYRSGEMWLHCQSLPGVKP